MIPAPGQSPPRRLIAMPPLHEAGHLVAALCCGGSAAMAFATARRGRAGAFAPTALGQLVVMTAGIAAETVIRPFYVEAISTPTIEPLDPELFGSRDLHLQSWNTVAEEQESKTTEFRDDRGQFEDALAALVKQGRIKDRGSSFFSRWWWRCRRHAERIIEAHRHEVKLLAAALDRHGLLLKADIDRVLEGTPLVVMAGTHERAALRCKVPPVAQGGVSC